MSQVVSCSQTQETGGSTPPPTSPPTLTRQATTRPPFRPVRMSPNMAHCLDLSEGSENAKHTETLPRVAYDPDQVCPIFYGLKVTVVATPDRNLVFLDPMGAKDPLFIQEPEVAEFVRKSHEVLQYYSSLGVDSKLKDGVAWSYELRSRPTYNGKYLLNLQIFRSQPYIWLKYMRLKSPNFFSGTKAMARLEPIDLTPLLAHLTHIFAISN